MHELTYEKVRGVVLEEKKMKKFFLRPAGGTYAYCSHCGKMVKQDYYNLRKHGETCGFLKEDIFEVLKEKDFGCTWEKEQQDTLKLTIYRPCMKLRPGFKDRYEKGVWEGIFFARFRWNSRRVEEKGEGNIGMWLYMISKRAIRYLGTTPVAEIIADVFPVVPFIYELNMFYHIYENKGYQVIPYEPSEKVKKEYGQIRRNEIQFVRTDSLCGETYVFGDLLNVQGKSILALRLYNVGEDSEMEFRSIYVGEGILWMSDSFLRRFEFCWDIWNKIVICCIPEGELEMFHRDCPSFGLGQYLAGGGQNILIPLLASGNFHKGIELLVKSGMSWYADNFYKNDRMNLFGQEPFPWEYKNVPEFLELPKALLKEKHPEYFVQQKTRRRVSYIYSHNRSLIEGIPLTMNVLRFMLDQDITRDQSVRLGNIQGLDELSDQEMRKIIKYLAKLPQDRYEDYRDYLQLVHDTRIHSFGYCPAQLSVAHDDLARELWTRAEAETDEEFRNAVEAYRYLETYTEPAEEETAENITQLKNDYYLVRCPRSVADLNQEGRNQHNCVATYQGWIVKGRSKILFMREKSAPDASLVTLEVQKKSLVQAKAFGNMKAPEECQRFICEWCDYYGISYKDCRDITLKVG